MPNVGKEKFERDKQSEISKNIVDIDLVAKEEKKT